MVTGAAVENAGMHVCLRSPGEALKKIIHQLCLQISDQARCHFRIHHSGGSPTEIHCGHAHSFVHGHQEVSSSKNAAFAAQSLIEGLAKYDAHVLDRVVLVDMQIAVGLELQIESAMMGKQLQHVVEETYAGGDLIAAASLDGQGQPNLRFLAHAVYGSLPHRRPAPC